MFVEQESPLGLPDVSAILIRAEGCEPTLRRWRFPSNVKGWTAEEQDVAVKNSPTWFQHFNVNARCRRDHFSIEKRGA